MSHLLWIITNRSFRLRLVQEPVNLIQCFFLFTFDVLSHGLFGDSFLKLVIDFVVVSSSPVHYVFVVHVMQVGLD